MACTPHPGYGSHTSNGGSWTPTRFSGDRYAFAGGPLGQRGAAPSFHGESDCRGSRSWSLAASR